jgi:hypothetical protein
VRNDQHPSPPPERGQQHSWISELSVVGVFEQGLGSCRRFLEPVFADRLDGRVVPEARVDGKNPSLSGLLPLDACDFVQDLMGETDALLDGLRRFQDTLGPLPDLARVFDAGEGGNEPGCQYIAELLDKVGSFHGAILGGGRVRDRVLLQVGQVGADEGVDGVESSGAVLLDAGADAVRGPFADGAVGLSAPVTEPISSPSR